LLSLVILETLSLSLFFLIDHNSGSFSLGVTEFNPSLMDVVALAQTIPTYAQGAALSLLLKQPKEFAKMIL
jgi:hypothetical protein